MIQTNDIITISGVSGYIDKKGTAWLNLDNVARGLGFTRTAESGNEVVRWDRVESYLYAFGFVPTDGHDGFIPENIFYRLAFKASNKIAEAFQGKVADEILPAIRRTGAYSAQPMTQIQMLAAQAQAMAELEMKTNAALATAQNAEKRISGALDALAAPAEKDWQAVTGEKVRRICSENQISYVKLFGDLYQELEDSAHVDLQSRVMRMKARMKKAGHTCKEVDKITKLHVIGCDPALKLAFDGIVRRVDAKYVADRLPEKGG
jgi:prophage antirepressor-like protein